MKELVIDGDKLLDGNDEVIARVVVTIDGAASRAIGFISVRVGPRGVRFSVTAKRGGNNESKGSVTGVYSPHDIRR